MDILSKNIGKHMPDIVLERVTPISVPLEACSRASARVGLEDRKAFLEVKLQEIIQIRT